MCSRRGSTKRGERSVHFILLVSESGSYCVVSEAWKCPNCDAEDSGSDEEEAERERPVSSSRRNARGKRTSRSTSHSNRSAHSNPFDDEPRIRRKGRKRATSSVEPDDQAVLLRKRIRRASNAPSSTHEDGTDLSNPQDPRAPRNSRLKTNQGATATIQEKSRTSLIVKFQVRPGNLKEFLSRKKRERVRNGPGAARTPRPAANRPLVARAAAATPGLSDTPLFPTPFTSDSYSTPFYSFFDRETDDAKGKPYGGILNDAEADTSKTLPTTDDRRRFDHAKQRAEDEWRARIMSMRAEAVAPVRKPKKVSDHASQIECIEFGGWEVDTWYAAPYPAEYSRNRVLYICEFCLKYINSDYVAWRHKLKCATKHPPGDEIYRDGSIAVFEVDGRKNPVYCQNLCLLAKLFLGSKTLYYDVEPFLFYVLCEYDDCGYHFVGYFSKEKRASSQNNVSCILTLPIHQRKGYGNLLIDFSYLLTRVEEKTGSPEKPLSDMGLVSYRNYWRLILCRYFLQTMDRDDHEKEGLSVKQISDDTGMTADDVISALEGLRALVRDPQTKAYAFRVDLDYCRQYVGKWETKGYVKLRPEALVWTPYVMGRSSAVNFELGPPISTVAPREDDEPKIVDEVQADAVEEDGPNGIAGANFDDTANEAGLATDEAKTVPEGEPETKLEGQPANEDKENTTPDEDLDEVLDDADPEDWRAPYNEIPPSRFEIFPPPAGGRRTERSRSGLSRPNLGRTASGNARPRRPAGSSVRRSTGSRPRPSSARRKTGGTGRGPGRWPKGTKKSDYGNAASGPGLPPGWKKGDSLELVVASGLEEPAEDVVQVTVRSSAESDTKMVNGLGTSGEVTAQVDGGEMKADEDA